MNDETNKILGEILIWARLQGSYLLESVVLPLLLDSSEKRRVYEMTDGSLTAAEISKKVRVSMGTISNWWNLWYEKGILIKEGKRYRKLINSRLEPTKEATKNE